MASCELFLIYLLTFFVTLILQSVGLFTPYWISWKDCDAQGLFYYKSSKETNGCYGPGSNVSNSAFVLEIISFVLHLVVCVIRMYCICLFDLEWHRAKTFIVLSRVLFTVAGILSLVGCTEISKVDISGSHLGSSYNMCLASGIYAMILCSLAFLGFTSDTTQHREQDSGDSKQGEMTVEEHRDAPQSGGMKSKAIIFVRFMR
ncbi:uncharacterized protein [Argopecten irradians]|uniref:uncharacterized protein n=1 Tax=Argopecten irradians TaxID=31199 RepID=UPI003712C469